MPSFVMKPASIVSAVAFSSVSANLASSARCLRLRDQATIDAVEMVEVGLPLPEENLMLGLNPGLPIADWPRAPEPYR